MKIIVRKTYLLAEKITNHKVFLSFGDIYLNERKQTKLNNAQFKERFNLTACCKNLFRRQFLKNKMIVKISRVLKIIYIKVYTSL